MRWSHAHAYIHMDAFATHIYRDGNCLIRSNQYLFPELALSHVMLCAGAVHGGCVQHLPDISQDRLRFPQHSRPRVR